MTDPLKCAATGSGLGSQRRLQKDKDERPTDQDHQPLPPPSKPAGRVGQTIRQTTDEWQLRTPPPLRKGGGVPRTATGGVGIPSRRSPRYYLVFPATCCLTLYEYIS